MDENQLKKEIEKMQLDSSEWGESHNWYYRDLNVHFRAIGNETSTPLLLIHGFGASSDHWRNNAELFASEGFRVYGIDLIGFGRSEQPHPSKIKYLDNQFWAEQISSFLDEVIDIRKNGKAILIGNSLGALTAITTLTIRPDAIKAVVAAPLPEPILLNPFEPLIPAWFKKITKLILEIIFSFFPLKALINLISRTKLITFALQSAYHRSIKKDISLKRIVTFPARRPNASKALRAMCLGMSKRSNIKKGPSLLLKIKKLTKRPPILLIWGENDKLIPLFLAKRLVKLHPWLKLSVINNAGHCPHDESPKDFNQLVLKWLEINLKTSNKLI